MRSKTAHLNDEQLKVISNIALIVGQLAAASMVVPFLSLGEYNIKLSSIILGVSVTISSWVFGIIIVKGIKK